MSRQVEVFEPINESQVGLYACGFTTYDYTHIGHLRKYSMDDVLVRALRAFGYDLRFVQNVTDVGHLASDADEGEDKMEKGAKKYGQTVWEIAQQFEEYFFYSMDLMGNLRPDVSCRATEHIKEQLAMVVELEKKGYAYVIEGDGVYFDTSKLDDYGKLAQLQLDSLQEGARIDVVAGKRNPTDFALWKFEREGENRAMVWPSPWHERSFPGWHIECSAMSMKYLGEQFDLHTGGIDHIPVHHTNEIAQAEAATGKKPFVRYWVHHNHLHVDGEKMSKSLGNFFTIDDVLAKGYSPKALRILFLGSHYRSEMNFTWESLDGAQKAWTRLLAGYTRLYTNIDASQSKDDLQNVELLNEGSREILARFYEAIAEDLNTSKAMAIVWEVLKHDALRADQKIILLNTFDTILGLDLEGEMRAEEHQISPEVQRLIEERKIARKNRDWELSDKLRDQIHSAGYVLKDENDGSQTVELKS